MRLADLRGARVAVWGAGVEGAAAVSLLQRGADVASITVVVDQARPTDPTAVHGVGVVDLSNEPFPNDVTAVLKSPGISPYHGRLAALRAARPDLPVFGGTALWFAEAAAAHGSPLARTIAVTGSKGKSTTSSLIAHLLGALTTDVLLAGNVGRAPLDVLSAGFDDGDPFPESRWHVLELSSFQASEVVFSPGVGVLTSLFPEHLDWHLTVERYYNDKINLFRHGHGNQLCANMANDDVAHLLSTKSSSASTIAMRAYGSSGFVVQDLGVWESGNEYVAAAQIPLLGEHNALNVCGALSAIRAAGWEPWEHRTEITKALGSFLPLAHRLQPVGTVQGRLVIDDSLSTAPQAAVAALAAYRDREVGILIGGHDRGLDYEPLARALASREQPTWVAAVPQSGPRIAAVVREMLRSDPDSRTRTNLIEMRVHDEFDDAVRWLSVIVPDGGVLLLSPAAPSFGRFRDYKDRGLRFRELLGL